MIRKVAAQNEQLSNSCSVKMDSAAEDGFNAESKESQKLCWSIKLGLHKVFPQKDLIWMPPFPLSTFSVEFFLYGCPHQG